MILGALAATQIVLGLSLLSNDLLNRHFNITSSAIDSISVLCGIVGIWYGLRVRGRLAQLAGETGVAPLNAQFLLDMILPPEKLDDQLSTLDELYRRKLPRLGKGRADLWYWKAALGLFLRQLFDGRKKLTIKLLAVALRLRPGQRGRCVDEGC